ncbi:MAG: hypothetical protein ACYTFW_26910, partial [Planctomycetota bacterium]
MIDGITAGTGAASKAVVLAANGNFTAPSGTWDLSGVTGITLAAGEIVAADVAADVATQAELDAVAALVDTDDEIIAIINDSPGTQIGVAAGGTGAGTFTDGGLLVGATTGAFEALAVGLATEVLVGGGAGTNPAWGTDLPTGVTIGSAYIYRVGGTDVNDANVADDLTIASTKKLSTTLTTEQLRLNYDATNYATWTVGANGDLIIATVDADAGTSGNVTISPDGILTLTPATTITGAVTLNGGITSIGAAADLTGGTVTLAT